VLDSPYGESFYDADLTLEKALYTVAPLADVAVELRRNTKSKRKLGKLILLKDFQ